MASTDFGTQVTIAGVTMKVINVPPPKLSVGMIETTNHSSAGWKEYITDSLKGASSFSVTAELTGAMLAQLTTVWAALAPVAITFTEYGIPAWTFNGLIGDIAMSTANAKSPGEETVDITIQPTGAVTIAAVGGNWYTDVTAIFTDVGGAYTTPAVPGTHQLIVYKVIPGLPDQAMNATEIAACTFASTVGAKATVSAAGLITAVASGATVVTVLITAKATVTTTINVTVP
jgi:hypothetical protein